MRHIGLPLGMALVVAAIIETLGLAVVNTSLRMWEFNQVRRKTDPRAPTWLGIGLGLLYLAATLCMIVALDVWPDWATLAPAMFPFLAIVGTVNLALIASQERREAIVQEERQERKAMRQATRQASVAPSVVRNVARPSNDANLDANLDRMRQGRQAKHDSLLDALATFYETHPDAGATEAARHIGVSRQTIYGYRAELESAGRLHRNGDAAQL
jgi:transposase